MLVTGVAECAETFHDNWRSCTIATCGKANIAFRSVCSCVSVCLHKVRQNYGAEIHNL